MAPVVLPGVPVPAAPGAVPNVPGAVLEPSGALEPSVVESPGTVALPLPFAAALPSVVSPGNAPGVAPGNAPAVLPDSVPEPPSVVPLLIEAELPGVLEHGDAVPGLKVWAAAPAPAANMVAAITKACVVLLAFM